MRWRQVFHNSQAINENPDYYGFTMRYSCAVVLACALASTARAQFLVPDQQFRCPPSDSKCQKMNKAPALEHGMSAINHHPFTINYVEFTDKGTLWDPQELDDAISQFTAAADDGNQHPLVVVYVHGWQNNASEGSGDVAKFREMVSGLADDYPLGLHGKAPQVVGIYLAWRGLTFTVEPFKHIVSYWLRRQTAKHVGRTGMYQAIESIKSAVNSDPRVRRNSFLIFVGHSFGARVLENAIEGLDANGKPRGFMSVYFDQMHKAAQGARENQAKDSSEEAHATPDIPADLIVYVNAATSAAKTQQRVRQIEDDCRYVSAHPICNADPLYVAFSSINDWATAYMMPLANLVIPDLISDKLDLLSAADSPWMHTHHSPKPGCPLGETICFDIAGKKSPPARFYLPRIATKAQVAKSEDHPSRSDPFWIFNVHPNLVNGHSDLWNSNVASMIAVILHNNERFEKVSAAATAVAARELNPGSVLIPSSPPGNLAAR
jgi:hypothetical protein